MSVDATIATWKLKKVTAIQKLLLLSLADRAGESAECWPSIKRLMADTNLNRKTIIENRMILIKEGYISYTGEFKGQKKQIPVMKLLYVKHREGLINTETDEFFTSTENGSGKVFTSTENGTGTSTENGTLNLKEEPKRSSSGGNLSGTERLQEEAQGKVQKLFKKHEIKVPKKLTKMQLEYIGKAIAYLNKESPGLELEGYLEYLVNECAGLFMPYESNGRLKQIGFSNILRPSFIKKALSKKYEDHYE